MTESSQNLTREKPFSRFFLIGFMGSGKTHWGKIWAQKNNLLFYDLDELIEQQEGQSIAAIFENKGETYFRKAETETLRALYGKEDCIIACGGGTACFNNNMQWMNENGTTVFLSATAPYILARVKEEKDKRPLINKLNEAELLFFIEQKIKERAPFYNQAKITLQANDLAEDSLTISSPKR